MTLLSETRINAVAPYRVKVLKDGGAFFATDNGLHYIVSFDADDVSLSVLCYQLVIVNVDNKPSPRDHKLRDTIIAIVEEFFSSSNEVLLYICETRDGKQALRNRLFRYWYSQNGQHKGYTYLSASVLDDDGVMNYAMLIMRNDSPHYATAYRDFGESIQMLNNKFE
uniref:Uncharacterized protein n=1 Tax=Prevotella sp. GTC17260 TaxID=3236796 RepID=A0AB33JGU8_9BACT